MRIPVLLLVVTALLTSPAQAQDCIDYGEYIHRVGRAYTGGISLDATVDGDFAYVAGHEHGLRVFNVADPAN